MGSKIPGYRPGDWYWANHVASCSGPVCRVCGHYDHPMAMITRTAVGEQICIWCQRWADLVEYGRSESRPHNQWIGTRPGRVPRRG